MRIIKSRVRYKEPETFEKAKEQEMNQKPYKPVYTGEAYEKNIEQVAEDAVADEYLRDVSVAQRVVKVQEYLDSGATLHDNPIGENAWFIRKVDEYSGTRYMIEATGVNCTVTGGGRIREGKTCTLVANVPSHFSLSSGCWVGLPSTAVVSSDFKTASWTVDAAVSGITCTAVEDSKNALTFSVTNATISATADGESIASGDVIYENSVIVMTVVPDTHFYMTEAAWGTMPTGTTYNTDYTEATFSMPNAVTSIVAAAIEQTKSALSFSATDASITVTVDGVSHTSGDDAYAGSAVIMVVAPSAHYYMDASAWSGLPTGTTFSADYTVATFTMPSATVTAVATAIAQLSLDVVTRYCTVVGTKGGEEVTFPYYGEDGDEIVVTVTPNDHYQWDYWNNTDPTSPEYTANPRTFVLSSSLSPQYEAICKAQKHLLASCSYGTIDITEGWYDAGTSVTLTVTPSTTTTKKYKCDSTSWSGIPSTATFSSDYTTATFTMDDDYTAVVTCVISQVYITATTVVNCTVTVVAASSTLVLPSWVDYGTACTATCTFDTSLYKFVEWDNGSENNPQNFTAGLSDSFLDWSCTVVDKDKYRVKFYAGNSHDTVTATVGGVAVTSPVEVTSGTAITLTCTVGSQRTWQNWTRVSGTVPGTLTDNPFTFTVTDDVEIRSYTTNDIALKFEGSAFTLVCDSGNVLFSTDKSTWKSSMSGTSDVVYVKDDNAPGTAVYGFRTTTGSVTKVSGPLMALVDAENYDTATMIDYQFCDGSSTSTPGTGLFGGMSDLSDITGLVLPDHVTKYCFADMFYNCSSLTDASSISFVSGTAEGCYYCMFQRCTGLTNYDKCPSLSSMSLSESCYNGMFSGCTALVIGPTLPALIVPTTAYSSMFNGCTALTALYDPDDPTYNMEPIKATTLTGTNNFSGMFQSCGSDFYGMSFLVENLTSGCFERLFKGSSSATWFYSPLTSVPSTAADSFVEWKMGAASTGVIYGPSATDPGWEAAGVIDGTNWTYEQDTP